jgi:hypothetical protein
MQLATSRILDQQLKGRESIGVEAGVKAELSFVVILFANQKFFLG